MPAVPREHLWNISQIGLFYSLALVAALLFTFGAVRWFRRWRSGWPVTHATNRTSWASDVFGGAGIFATDRPGGLAHLCVVWGFVVLFLGTVLLTIDHYLVNFLTGDIWLVYSFVLDLFGAAFVLGVAWLLFRRHVLRRRLAHRQEPEDSLLLGLLLVVGLSGFLVEGLRLAQVEPPLRDGSPVGEMVARLMPTAALGAHRIAWWAHAACSLLLVAWIPFGKLKHAFTSAFHRRAVSRLPEIRTAEERERATVAFGAHELLAIDACTRCNRCENVCPSTTVAEALSPRRVIAELDRASRAGLATADRTSASAAEVLWLCTACGACAAACPIRIDTADLIRETRSHLVEEGTAVPEGLGRALESLAKHGNPWEGKRSKRAAWAEGLDLRDFSRQDSAPLLWLPGCTLAYDTRCRQVARATAKLLSATGEEFMIAGKREHCSGELARRCGEEGLFEMLVEENAALFSESGAAGVLVSSPHDGHALSTEYPRLPGLLQEAGGTVRPVRHVTELTAERVRSGGLQFDAGPPRRAAFHDPCYLGRQHGIFEPPRTVLRAIPGITLVELEGCRESSLCCGGGGGRMYFEPEHAGKTRMSEQRIQQALDAGAELLATACPWCLIQLEDAVKTAGVEQRLRVADVTEIAAEALSR